jgi:hypothetical protein
MDLQTLEAIAVEFYRRHKLDPATPTSTFKLARRAYHPQVITRPPTLLGRFPACAYVNHETGQQHIAIRRTVPDDEQQWYVGHELAHLVLGTKHGDGAEIEAACDYLGAALMAPRPAVLALYRSFGWNVSAIAREVTATQTWAGLRVAETMLMPLAAVSPIAVRVRGPEEWVWPDERTIRGWASGHIGPGLRKVRVTDRPKRSLLLAV